MKRVSAANESTAIESGIIREPMWADPDSEFEHEVLNELRLKSFMETLSERDREILNLKMQGMTDQKIAEKVGFKNHSAVVKRRKQIAEHFQKYVENE